MNELDAVSYLNHHKELMSMDKDNVQYTEYVPLTKLERSYPEYCKRNNLDPAERSSHKEYDYWLMHLYSYEAQLAYAYQQGYELGLQKARVRIIKLNLIQDIPDEDLIKYFDYTKEEIEEVRSSMEA